MSDWLGDESGGFEGLAGRRRASRRGRGGGRVSDTEGARIAELADRHDARTTADSLRCLLAEWRVGGKVSRNIYAVVGDAPGEDDIAIGQMDTGQLAREAVYRHNDARRRR